jgi:hypothetical protein
MAGPGGVSLIVTNANAVIIRYPLWANLQRAKSSHNM